MSTPNQTDVRTKPAHPLEGHPDPVRYDVAAGLARHRALVAAGHPLPDWAKERSGLAHATLRGVVLTGLAGLILSAGFLTFPRPDSPASQRGAGQAGQAEAAPPSSLVVAPPSLPAQTLAHVVSGEAASVEARRTLTATARSSSGASRLPRATARTVSSRLPHAAAAVETPPASAALTEATRGNSVKTLQAKATLVEAAPPTADVPKGEPAPLAKVPSASVRPERPSEVSSTAAPAEANGSKLRAVQPPVARPQIQTEQPAVLSEMEQLKLAERLLAREPRRTLSIVRAGLEQFRPGYFTQERRYLEVMALLALGSVDEARMRARAFVRDYPEAPYRRKVERALAQPAAAPRSTP